MSSGELCGYQAGVPHVQKMISSLYQTFLDMGFAYINPPSSFEYGQKIRSPLQIFNQKNGTCLDYACFFASCMEQMGLNPVLLVMPGHAWMGAWLDDYSGYNPVSWFAALCRQQLENQSAGDIPAIIEALSSFPFELSASCKNLLTENLDAETVVQLSKVKK